MTTPHVQTNHSKLAMQVSRNTIIGNFVLTAFKLAAGILGHSSAMLSDAIHSASDVFSTLIVMVGIRISGKKADGNHNYGHERLEAVAANLLAVGLAAPGVFIGHLGGRPNPARHYCGLQGPRALGPHCPHVSLLGTYWMYLCTPPAAA